MSLRLITAPTQHVGPVPAAASADRRQRQEIGAEPNGLTIGMSAATASDAGRTISAMVVAAFP